MTTERRLLDLIPSPAENAMINPFGAARHAKRLFSAALPSQTPGTSAPSIEPAAAVPEAAHIATDEGPGFLNGTVMTAAQALAPHIPGVDTGRVQKTIAYASTIADATDAAKHLVAGDTHGALRKAEEAGIRAVGAYINTHTSGAGAIVGIAAQLATAHIADSMAEKDRSDAGLRAIQDFKQQVIETAAPQPRTPEDPQQTSETERST